MGRGAACQGRPPREVRHVRRVPLAFWKQALKVVVAEPDFPLQESPAVPPAAA